MSSAGHIFEMINRIKQNEALKKDRRNMRDKIREAYLQEIKNHHPINDTHKLPPAELAELKRKIKLKIIKERRRRTTMSVILICCLLFLLVYGSVKVLL